MSPYDYEYYYEYPDMDMAFDAGFAGAMLGIIFIFYFIMMALSVAAYVFQSLSLYTIAKRRGIHNPWLSWLPVGNMWILGSISDQYQYVAKGRVRNRRKLLMGLTIGMLGALVLMYSSVFGLALGLAGESGAIAGGSLILLVLMALALCVVAVVAMVYQYISIYDLYASCEPSNAVLYLVLSIFFAVAMPIFFFICRKKDLGMPPRKTDVPEQPVLQPVFETVAEEPAKQETEE